MTRKILLLHGNRQTGDLLLGRMAKLRKRLQKQDIHIVAPTALLPHPEDPEMRTWWNRNGNAYEGLDVNFEMIQEIWNSANGNNEETFVGVFGFSQGARLAHLIAVAHERQPDLYFPELQFVIMAAGYDKPLPDGFDSLVPSIHGEEEPMSTHSLHVWGKVDKLISPKESKAQLPRYSNPEVLEHEGGHHVPMKAACVNAYMDFIQSSLSQRATSSTATTKEATCIEPVEQAPLKPDEETAELQRDEVEALTAIFPDEFNLLSSDHPITFRIDLVASEEGQWPPHPIALHCTYPHDYPQESLPEIRLEHDNNMMEFSSAQTDALMDSILEAAKAEEGMPCVMSCVYAAREFFESGAMGTIASTVGTGGTDSNDDENDSDQTGGEDEIAVNSSTPSAVLRPASPERIHQCNLQGLEIAESLLRELGAAASTDPSSKKDDATVSTGKGGQWTYTIGLVGKPSAGKSTLFNASTAFARQRDDKESALGGASMAPHPFTTIDPNVGYCLVPAPPGSCPEDDSGSMQLDVGCTHGRDNQGRRLLPALLKDVAGLVPGAYQGRGRGNKFLNDLTDADVLIHVLDASGTADVEGNDLGTEEDGRPSSAASHPLNDMSWIRTELIEWVFSNLLHKWDSVKRRGRSKLTGMFSGYGQTRFVTWKVLDAVEKYLEREEQRGHTLDQLDDWDEGDVHRLVSAFLGVRFPMALAMNKCDLPTSKAHVRDIQAALPIHGAFASVPLSARSEMNFLRRHIEEALNITSITKSEDQLDEKLPEGVWQCLQSAVSLREPVLVFPVNDFVDYAPLPGLNKHATSDPSLPSPGMIACLEAAGGTAPTLWDAQQGIYCAPSSRNSNNKKTTTTTPGMALRDVLVMKPGSTVEDVFVVLKRLGALSGEFVRAEAAGAIGAPSRPIPKHQVMNKHDRILKIMSSKRTAWQQNK